MRYVFVTGCPRSGTTALARLLNVHPNVVCGIERYKFYARDHGPEAITPDLFASDRFLDVRPSDTNVQPRPDATGTAYQVAVAYEEARAKFADGRVAVVGDKLPRVGSVRQTVRASFPDASVVVIVRDPYEVASSFLSRARDPSDSWPADSGVGRAVARWNLALKHTAELARRAAVFVVRYARLFAGDHNHAQSLFGFLGLDHIAETRAWIEHSAAQWAERQAKPSLLDAEGREYIAAKADWDRYHAILDD